jgi:hypothetical protein
MMAHSYRKIPLIIAALVILAALLPSSAYADQSVTAGNLTLGMIGEQEFEAGYVLVPRLPIFWESDIPWTISIYSLDADLGISDEADFVKPLDDLLWKPSDEDVWLPLSQDPEEVAWSMDTGSGVVYIDVILRLDWLTDGPGDYQANILFTIEPL